MNKFKIVILLSLLSILATAQKYKIDTIQYQGTDKNIINLVILADGYTKDEIKYFTEDANRFTNYFFKTEPFNFYNNYFNVFAIETISEESGAIHDLSGADCPEDNNLDLMNLPHRFNKFKHGDYVPKSNPNTIFKSKFDVGKIHRLVVPQNEQLIRQILMEHVPNFTQVVVLVNSPYYGGSGGELATTTVNFKSNDIAVHEIGHSFGSLSDEYWAGNVYAKEGYNFTQNATDVPWKHWLGTNGIGVYNYGAEGSKANWFRPHEYCKMQYLVAPFCNVCQEKFIETIHDKTNPILKTNPENNRVLVADSINLFSLKLAKPSPNTLKVDWYLNQQKIASNIDSIYLNKGLLTNGLNYLLAEVKDTTNLIRIDTHQQHSYSTSWTIENNKNYTLEAPLSTWGNKIETCYNANQTLSVKNPKAGIEYRWYAAENPNKIIGIGSTYITPKITKNTTFFVESYSNNKTSNKTAIQVNLIAEIKPFNKIKITKKNDHIIVKVSGKKEPNISYRWFYDNQTPIYKSGEENKHKFSKILETDNQITLKNTNNKQIIYIQKYNTITTCLGEKTKIDIN